MQNLLSTSATTEVKYLIDLAEEERVARRLDFIYSQVPMNNCRRCADCCFNSPQVHPIEFLSIYEWLTALPELKQLHLGRKLIEYELLNLTTLKNKCPFLKRLGCLIYERRPLQCRLFGLYPREEYEDIVTKCRLQNEELSGYYRRVKKLPLPKAVMTYDIDQCANNIDKQGRLIVIPADDRARLNAQIHELSRQALPVDWHSPNLLSFSNQYSLMHMNDEELETTKITAIKEFQRHGRSQALDKLLAQTDWRF